MRLDAATIARRIDRLDHPDSILQDQILKELSAIADQALPVVAANFPLVNARIRRALLRWLPEHFGPELLLPLMRYIFDEADNIQEQTGRVMAMSLLVQRARGTALPEELGRFRAFAEDLARDRDPEIRALSMRLLSYTGNQRSIPIVEALRDDPEKEVCLAAREAFEALQDSPTDSGASELDPGELFTQLLNSAGPRRRQLVRQLRRHPENQEIALQLLRHRGELREEALQVLLTHPTPKARPFLAAIVLGDPEDGKAALAIRLLAALASDEGAHSDEIDALRYALRARSPLSQQAAAGALGAFGATQFLPDLIEMALLSDLSLALEAAKALNQLANSAQERALQPLLQALEINDRRRLASQDEEERVHLVAHLQSAIRKILTPQTLGVESFHRLALTQLRRAAHLEPIAVTALQILLASTPEGGLDEERRFSPQEVRSLLNLLPRLNQKAASPLATILFRVAPRQMPGLDQAARQLWETGAVDLNGLIIPLLERSETKEALQMLESIAAGHDSGAADRARALLREDRNQREFIDVEFIPRDPNADS